MLCNYKLQLPRSCTGAINYAHQLGIAETGAILQSDLMAVLFRGAPTVRAAASSCKHPAHQPRRLGVQLPVGSLKRCRVTVKPSALSTSTYFTVAPTAEAFLNRLYQFPDLFPLMVPALLKHCWHLWVAVVSYAAASPSSSTCLMKFRTSLSQV